jgi:hypothetical protein
MGGSDCEQIRSGWLAQPANASSSLVYVAVGIWLLWRSRAPDVRRAPLVSSGAALVAVGVGSFAFHGPQPGWAHVAHDGSALLLTLLLIADHISLLVRARMAVVLAAWKAAAPWMVLALAAYWAGRTASPLCSPSALWQPHAAWHALSAVGLGLAARVASASEYRFR